MVDFESNAVLCCAGKLHCEKLQQITNYNSYYHYWYLHFYSTSCVESLITVAMAMAAEWEENGNWSQTIKIFNMTSTEWTFNGISRWRSARAVDVWKWN